MDWERARQPEQKAVRRNAILSAARDMFAEGEYESISLNGIAKRAGFAKPNVYRYFSSREEIFLTIFHAEQKALVSSLVGRFARIRAKDPVGRVAEIWVEESLKYPAFLNLLPVLMTSLEKNSSIEQIAEFKKETKEHIGQMIDVLQRVYPDLAADQWLIVVQSVTALMAGLWPLCNPAENVSAAMKLADFGENWEYESLMKTGICSLINGL